MAVERGVGDHAGLLLVMANFGIAAAQDLAGRRPRVVFGIAIVAVAADVVQPAAHGGGGVGRPLGLQFRAAVAVDDLAVGHVVVLLGQPIVHPAVDERRAEVAGGFLPGVGLGQREVQFRRHVQPQGSGDSSIA
ncbi:hypothetical protein G6F68_020163 [Rhizopus microsporus]|nr:hypothetical protein G6F68_020163 [Rhizopus microsporus]